MSPRVYAPSDLWRANASAVQSNGSLPCGSGIVRASQFFWSPHRWNPLLPSLHPRRFLLPPLIARTHETPPPQRCHHFCFPLVPLLPSLLDADGAGATTLAPSSPSVLSPSRVVLLFFAFFVVASLTPCCRFHSWCRIRSLFTRIRWRATFLLCFHCCLRSVYFFSLPFLAAGSTLPPIPCATFLCFTSRPFFLFFVRGCSSSHSDMSFFYMGSRIPLLLPLWRFDGCTDISPLCNDIFKGYFLGCPFSAMILYLILLYILKSCARSLVIWLVPLLREWFSIWCYVYILRLCSRWFRQVLTFSFII
jgi:hypothetical protein